MTYADLKLLEKDLHRELTDEEAVLAYSEGYKALLNSLGLDDELYVAYRRLLELVITYGTKSRQEFINLYNSKDYTSAITLMKEMVQNIADIKQGFDFRSDEPSAQGCEYSDAEYWAKIILEMMPDDAEPWIDLYTELDPDMTAYNAFVKENADSDVPVAVEESVGDALDVIKDATIELVAEDLAAGAYFELNEDILDEVVAYIEENWTNYSLKIVNRKISAKKF